MPRHIIRPLERSVCFSVPLHFAWRAGGSRPLAHSVIFTSLQVPLISTGPWTLRSCYATHELHQSGSVEMNKDHSASSYLFRCVTDNSVKRLDGRSRFPKGTIEISPYHQDQNGSGGQPNPWSTRGKGTSSNITQQNQRRSNTRLYCE
jgi:hypothetical protein